MRIPKNEPVIGYKAFTKDLQCRGYQFAIGKEYHHKGPIQLCVKGFHFCSSVDKVFDFAPYELNPQTTRVCSVLAWGNVQEDTRPGKYVASNIRVIRELSIQQILSAANFRGSNYGRYNSGSFNYGNCNTGRENLGDGLVAPEHADDKLMDCLFDLQEAIHSELDFACRRTCEHCGKDTVHLCKTHGYVQYLCEPCAEKTGRVYVRLT